jgi:hypothetical protein
MELKFIILTHLGNVEWRSDITKESLINLIDLLRDILKLIKINFCQNHV